MGGYFVHGGKEKDALGVVGSADQLGLLAERKLRDTLVPALDDTADTVRRRRFAVSSIRFSVGGTRARERAQGREGKDGPDLGDERLAAVARRVKLGAVRLESADVVLSIARESYCLVS